MRPVGKRDTMHLHCWCFTEAWKLPGNLLWFTNVCPIAVSEALTGFISPRAVGWLSVVSDFNSNQSAKYLTGIYLLFCFFCENTCKHEQQDADCSWLNGHWCADLYWEINLDRLCQRFSWFSSYGRNITAVKDLIATGAIKMMEYTKSFTHPHKQPKNRSLW